MPTYLDDRVILLFALLMLTLIYFLHNHWKHQRTIEELEAKVKKFEIRIWQDDVQVKRLHDLEEWQDALTQELANKQEEITQLKQGHALKDQSIALLSERCHELIKEKTELLKILRHDGWKAKRR